MNGYLLDTHILLWWLGDQGRLSQPVRDLIRNGENQIWLSAGATWEMGIKRGLGRLTYPNNLDTVLAEERIRVLPIQLDHTLAVADLPLHHQDPFDRIQIAQARIEDLVLITQDERLAVYEVVILRNE